MAKFGRLVILKNDLNHKHILKFKHKNCNLVPLPFMKILVYFTLTILYMHAQTLDSIQVIRSFQTGGGRIISTLSLQENYNDVEYISGWELNANYLFHNLTRLEFKFCTFEKTNILPFWKDAQLQNFNLNFHYITSNQTGSFFLYPLFGLSYTKFSSFQLIDKNFNKINQDKIFTQFGFNAGLGAEVHFKFLSIYADYNMRITKITSDNTTNVRNVSFSAGIRLFYFRMHWHKEDVSKKAKIKKRKRRKLFDILHDRYHWF